MSIFSRFFSTSIRVYIDKTCIADSEDAFCHGGRWYFPAADIDKHYFSQKGETNTCVWKGDYIYFDITVGDKVWENIAWSYFETKDPGLKIKDHITFDDRVKVQKEVRWLPKMRT